MKKLIALSILLLFVFGSFGQDSVKKTIVKYAENNELSIERPFNDSTTLEKPQNSLNLNKENWEILGLEKLEEFNNIFEYSIYSIYKHKNNFILLISRDYSSETVHWICLFNKKFELKQFEMSAYDNDEGFLYISTEISDEYFLINKWEIEEGTQTFNYSIKKNKFELISVSITID
ncbi:MAG: hypothetical protein JXL97_01725 [Bacteroidales bacterium]|nr:hypothetical protein [Bacteroidales bacterium]